MFSFEWDEHKNSINEEKHGISFEEAKTVFYDEDAWLEYDDKHSAEEERFRLLGCSLYGNVLMVVHCVLIIKNCFGLFKRNAVFFNIYDIFILVPFKTEHIILLFYKIIIL